MGPDFCEPLLFVTYYRTNRNNLRFFTDEKPNQVLSSNRFYKQIVIFSAGSVKNTGNPRLFLRLSTKLGQNSILVFGGVFCLSPTNDRRTTCITMSMYDDIMRCRRCWRAKCRKFRKNYFSCGKYSQIWKRSLKYGICRWTSCACLQIWTISWRTPHVTIT